MRQTKAFVAILMQINCVRHNLAFHVSPVPPGVRLPSLKPWEPAQSLHKHSSVLPHAPLHRKGGREAERGSGHPGEHISSKTEAEKSDLQHHD